MHSSIPNVWVKLSKVHQNFQVVAGKQETKPQMHSSFHVHPVGIISSVQSCNVMEALTHLFSEWFH